MKTQNQVTVAQVLKSLDVKIAAHTLANGIAPDDVTKSKGKIDQFFVDYINKCEKAEFAKWSETAPTKSIMRAVNFIAGLSSLDASLGNDHIAQALIETALLLNAEVLPLAVLKHQTIIGKETDELSTMTKGVSIRKGQRRMSEKTALSMISNRCGKNGYMQFLGLVTRADDKGIVINKKSPFYIDALNLLHPVKVAG